MNVVDSSAWLEYFAGGPNASYFSAPIEDTGQLIVPTLCLFEVCKRFMVQFTAREALEVASVMRRGTVVDLTADLALQAASLSVQWGLPLADSIVLATARDEGAMLWTQDSDFKDLPGVRYRERKP